MHPDDDLDEWLDRVPPMTKAEQAQILIGYVRAMARDLERDQGERMGSLPGKFQPMPGEKLFVRPEAGTGVEEQR